MASEDEGWVRQLSKFEEFLEIAHQHSFMVTCYCLTLNSKLPLQEYHIKRSLLHLLRKVSTLRLCIRPYNEKEMWFYNLENESIDFKILENADFQKEYEAMTVHHYNTYDGPLWCARLLPLSPDAPCAMPEIKEKFPHQYQFLFGFHHSITDGTSSVGISSFFVDLLNNVISGKPINDLEQLAEHASEEQTLRLIEEVSLELMKHPSEVQRYQKVLSGKIEDVLFLKAYPPPENVRPKTLNIAYSLPKDETSSFLKRCKKEGVTIHSGFCSVVNAAIVDMLVKAGIKEDVYKIKNYHTINNRRYWKGDTSRAFGALLGKLTFIAELTSNINDFWSHARAFHKTFIDLLNDRGSIKEGVVMLMNMPADIEVSKMIEEMPMGDNYYGTTNLGNLSSTFKGEGDHVQVTSIRRTTSTIKNLCSHVMQTFRGQFLYGLDYEAALMTKETAQMYVDTIFKVLKNVTEM